MLSFLQNGSVYYVFFEHRNEPKRKVGSIAWNPTLNEWNWSPSCFTPSSPQLRQIASFMETLPVKMKVEDMEPMPANSNPFNHDSYHMGHWVGKNVLIMMANHPEHECKYLIIINRETGERKRISFNG